MDRLDKLTVLSGSGDNSQIALKLSADLAERLGLSVIERWRVADVIDSHIPPILREELAEIVEDFDDQIGFLVSLEPRGIDPHERSIVLSTVEAWKNVKNLIETTFL